MDHIGSRESFEEMKQMIADKRQNIGYPVAFILVATKNDLYSQHSSSSLVSTTPTSTSTPKPIPIMPFGEHPLLASSPPARVSEEEIIQYSAEYVFSNSSIYACIAVPPHSCPSLLLWLRIT
jgi:hypothetical protein